MARVDRRPPRLLRWTATIRGRLLGGFVATLILGLTASTLSTSFLLQDYLRDRDLRTLRQAGDRVQQGLGDGTQTATVDADQIEALLGFPLGAIILGRDGEPTLTFGSGTLDTAIVARQAKRTPTGQVLDHYRGAVSVLALRLDTPRLVVENGAPGTVRASAVVLTIDISIADAARSRLVVAQLFVLLGTLAVTGGVALLVLRTGLRPLGQMAADAEAIAAGTREPGLPTHGGGVETDQLATAINKAFEARAAAENRIRDFAADASHELRTPLATISGWLELRAQGGLADPAALDRALDHVNVEVGRMRLLVEELSLLARLDAGRPLEHERVDLTALAQSIAEDARVVMRDLDLELVTPVGPLHVSGDEDRIAQVLRNLVGNAVQHTPAGTAVAITVERRGAWAVAEVSDRGPGIDAALLPHLFERFWRADSSRSRDHGGSGLGLAIVQAIVKAHGGTITARSQAGEGTTIAFTLPLADGVEQA